MAIRNLWPLTGFVTAMVVIDALLGPAVLLLALLFPESFDAVVAPIADALDLGLTGFTVLTWIVFATWIYVAGRNLVAAGYEGLAFSPASRIWWFAVPIANLVMPYQGMRELWNASHGNAEYSENQSLVGVWWALWLGGNLAASAIAFALGPDGGTTPHWFAGAIGIVQAAAAILLLRGIASAQANLLPDNLEEVFT